ncbi:MAG: hypothetical protein WC209_13835 [Ignavibacteriaceae bacterium]
MFFSLFPFLINKIEIEKEKIIFIYFIAFSTVMEFYVDTSAYLKVSVLWMSHIYFSAEYFFFFFILFQYGPRFKQFWLIMGGIVAVFVLADNFIITPFAKYSYISLSTQDFFLFLLSSWIIIELTVKNFVPFYKDDRFYIATGIFIYSSLMALMSFLFNSFLVKLPFSIGSWSIICMNFFFTYAMVLYYKQRKMLAEALK